LFPIEVKAIPIRENTAPATALVIVRWKPSAGSRSLSGISALSAPPARILARSDDSVRFAHREPASPFQSARGDDRGVGYRTFTVETACATRFSLAD